MSETISKAHDCFFKNAMSNKEIAKEFFEMHLPENLLSRINLNELEIQSGTFIDDYRNETIADMLFKTLIDDYIAYLYLIVDHQSTPKETMPFICFRYIYNIIADVMQNSKDKKIPLIIPLVVYHGKRPWT